MTVGRWICGAAWWLCAVSSTAWAGQSVEIPLPDKDYQWTISGEPHWLLLGPALSVTLERRLTDPHAIAGTFVAGQSAGAPLAQLHTQYRYYVVGDYDAGIHLGGMLSIFNGSINRSEAGGAVRGLVGGKYIFPIPISIESQVGLGFNSANTGSPFYLSLKVGYAF